MMAGGSIGNQKRIPNDIANLPLNLQDAFKVFEIKKLELWELEGHLIDAAPDLNGEG